MSLKRTNMNCERGQSLVLLAVLLPLILFIAVLSVDVGNWWVHKKRLQTQVDAAALAAGPIFRGCFRDPPTANEQIATEALKYAGDFHNGRDPANPGVSPPSLNQQVQEPGDVFVALNSNNYWQQSNGTVSPGTGYGLDYSTTTTAPDGKPCSVKFLDVKATDDDVLPLWGRIKNWRDFPKSVSPRTHAKIEARDIEAQSGMLPWAVPEIRPRAMAALFVNENGGANPVVFDYQMLGENDDSSLPWSEWSTIGGQEEVFLDSGHENTGVIILVSKEDPTPTTTGSLATICNPPPPAVPGLVRCYGGSTQTSGITFIHAYNGTRNGTVESPQARQVELFASGCSATDRSAPYFTLDGGCSAAVQAVIDFGVDGDPTGLPTCALVDGMNWSSRGLDDDLGTWTGSIPLPADSGRNELSIRTHTGPEEKKGKPDECKKRPYNPILTKAAVPYVATGDAGQNSGPVQYLKLTAQYADGNTVGHANSVELNDPGNPSYNYVVTVGLPKPLSIANWADPPVILRLGYRPGSQNQAFNCDGKMPPPGGGDIQYKDEIANGCRTTYRENFTDVDGDGDKEWRNYFCDGYSNQDLPPQTFNPIPPADCIRPETGDTNGQQRDGLHDRFETPCTSNNWPDTQAEADVFFGPSGGGYGNDPRYVTLVVVDDTAFQDSGSSDYFPIKYFAAFYVTGWDLQRNQTVGCPDIDGPSGPYKGNDCHPDKGCFDDYNSEDNADVWGYYVDIVAFSGAGTPGDLCAFETDPAACVAVLVE